MPTTSGYAAEECLEVYRELTRAANAVLHIPMTSEFTTMGYGAAEEAKAIARRESPRTTVGPIDYQTVGPAFALVVLKAAQAAAQGKSPRNLA